MKTRERILETSRDLFNEQGERSITASEIALVMDISPGNLYYHFKGKDDILAELWSRHQRALAGVLAGPVHDPGLFEQTDDSVSGRVERAWLYLTVVLETMYADRYLYHNLDDLMHRYDAIGRGFPRLTLMMRASCRAVAASLLEHSDHTSTPARFERIADAMTLTLVYWLSYDRLQHRGADSIGTVHSGVLQLLTVCAPYLGGEEAQFYEECEALHRRMLNT